jgi:TFIIF-interacting CTD phosphatase-like protein
MKTPVRRPFSLFASPPPAPPTKTSLPRLRVVLDIDETLVSTSTHESRTEYTSRGLRGGDLVFKYFNSRDRTYPTDKAITVERPGLQDFLTRVSAVADMYLYTSGVQEYAEAIAAFIDTTPEKNLFKGVFGREYMASNKYLPLIFRDNYLPARTVFIDDREDYHTMHVENGILIPYFVYRDEMRDADRSRCDNDKELAVVADLIVNELQHLEDVRPVLNERYGAEIRARLDKRKKGWEETVRSLKDKEEEHLDLVDENLKDVEDAKKRCVEERVKRLADLDKSYQKKIIQR